MAGRLWLFFGLFSSFIYAQIGGQSVYQFLNLMSSPRQAALGGKVLTFYDYDVNQGLFNPATINNDMHNQLSVNYSNLFGEVTYGTASYAYMYDRHVNTFHAGVQYINYGTFDGRDENGNNTGTFSGSEAALSVGYAYNFPFTNWYVGANAKLITSSLESYTSFGGALDIGILYRWEEYSTDFTLVVRNFGTQFTTYAGLRENMPFEILLGISQELEHVPIRWHLTFENLQQWQVAFANPARAQGTLDGGQIEERVGFVNNLLRHTIFGIELFPDRGFNLRVGYNFRRAEELSIVDQRTFSGISLGFGLKMNKIRFNYAYARYTAAANSSMFGMTINLN
ncbi:MAG: type IX secretion system protein PorQ [Flavobacterium sp.]